MTTNNSNVPVHIKAHHICFQLHVKVWWVTICSHYFSWDIVKKAIFNCFFQFEASRINLKPAAWISFICLWCIHVQCCVSVHWLLFSNFILMIFFIFPVFFLPSARLLHSSSIHSSHGLPCLLIWPIDWGLIQMNLFRWYFWIWHNIGHAPGCMDTGRCVCTWVAWFCRFSRRCPDSTVYTLPCSGELVRLACHLVADCQLLLLCLTARWILYARFPETWVQCISVWMQQWIPK